MEHSCPADTGSHQGARAAGAFESHFSTTPSLTTADPSATATSAATTFVASSSPDATEGSADHFSAPAPPAARDTTATGASTTETPAVPPLPPFHVPADAADAAPAASSSPGVALGADDGVTAVAAFAAGTCIDVDTDLIPTVVAPTPPSTGIHASPNKKRRRSHGPGCDAGRNLFHASKRRATADRPDSQGGGECEG